MFSNQPIGDSEKLAQGQQVFTACAFIHHNFDGIDKVFLPKRATTKKFLPGVFELPGGHIEFGEDMIEGLKREINEEFGVDVSVGDPFACFTYMNEIKQSHSIEVVYFAEFTSPLESIALNPSDHSEYVWVAADELNRVYSAEKGAEDQEFKVVRRGFELLQGGELHLAWDCGQFIVGQNDDHRALIVHSAASLGLATEWCRAALDRSQLLAVIDRR